MAKDQLSAVAAAIQSLDGRAFVTLHSRLDRCGALQARKLANGAGQLYWQYSYAGKTSREPSAATTRRHLRRSCGQPCAVTALLPRWRSAGRCRADKLTLSLEEMKAYWKLIVDRPGIEAAALRLHLMTGGQCIEQFIRLKWADVVDDAMTRFDGKGRPSQ